MHQNKNDVHWNKNEGLKTRSCLLNQRSIRGKTRYGWKGLTKVDGKVTKVQWNHGSETPTRSTYVLNSISRAVENKSEYVSIWSINLSGYVSILDKSNDREQFEVRVRGYAEIVTRAKTLVIIILLFMIMCFIFMFYFFYCCSLKRMHACRCMDSCVSLLYL